MVFDSAFVNDSCFYNVFNKIAKIETGQIPPSLFYMSGIIIWTYFSESLSQISNSFTSNAGLFNKVYFQD